MPRTFQTTHQIESYLEAIIRLERKFGVARVTDLATVLELKKGTVSAGLKRLRTRKLIGDSPYQPIRLTADGRNIAESVVERHRILKRFLNLVLNLDPDISETASRKILPVADDRVIERMKQMMEASMIDSTGLTSNRKD